jgi:hypothetical protein
MDKSLTATGVASLKTWTTPRLAFAGRVADVLQGGGGKLSITASDSGESRCEKGQDGIHCAPPA